MGPGGQLLPGAGGGRPRSPGRRRGGRVLCVGHKVGGRPSRPGRRPGVAGSLGKVNRDVSGTITDSKGLGHRGRPGRVSGAGRVCGSGPAGYFCRVDPEGFRDSEDASSNLD